MEREILMTTQVEGFLDDLYDADPVSHRLASQRSWSWSATARPRGARWPTR